MRRIRWFDPEPKEPSTPIEWRAAAAILATLFLNFAFWIGTADRFWMFLRLPNYALPVAALTLTATAIAFIGPGLAAFASKRCLFELVEGSLGSRPAYAVRLLCVAFSVLSIAAVVSVPVRWWLYFRESPPWQATCLAAALPLFLCYTGLQSLRTGARLAVFTNKLGIALLVAALWRVRDGWAAIPGGFESQRAYFTGWDLWRGFSELAAYVVPFGLLAADMAPRIRGRKQAVLTVAFGIAVPLFGSILLAGVIGIATLESLIYQPSLNPNVAMALFGKVASSAQPGRWMIAAVTTFGAARFCVRAIQIAAPVAGNRWKSIALIALCPAIGWLSLHPFASTFENALQFFANCLGVTSAVITADLLVLRRAAPVRMDWIGCAALLIGVALPWYVPHPPMEVSPNPWWYPWLLPCYVVAFVGCLTGRLLERAVWRRHGLPVVSQ